MKIRKIQFTNNPILGDLALDFTDHEGKVFNNIILAGENGAGKSVILNTIYNFSNLSLDNNKRDEKRYFEIEIPNDDLIIIYNNFNFKRYFNFPVIDNIFKVNIDYSIPNNWSQINITCNNKNGPISGIPGTLFSEQNTRKLLKTIFSDVEINFTPRNINSVTSMTVDNEQGNSIKSTSNLASEITQLLVDIQAIDSEDLSDWARHNTGSVVNEDIIDLRMKRFTSAFEYMFPYKKYKKILTNNGKKDVIFEENGKEMTIADLSSGEKQIVFRGGFLLKDKLSSQGALILIDEPEISLHPSWQLKIMSYFKMLFSNKEKQTSQIIVATHSPFIIHNANRFNDKVIILQKDSSGIVSILEEPKFYGWTPEQKVQEAFHLEQFIIKDSTNIFVEGETDEKYFKKAIEIFEMTDKHINVKWIGHLNDQGNPENTGKSALDNATNYYRANPQMLTSKLILLYDSDAKKAEETNNNFVIKCLKENSSNTIYRIGIENLLKLPTNFNYNTFYGRKENKDNYGGTTIKTSLDKMKLCNHICNDLSIDEQKNILLNIKTEIERILS